MPEFTINLKDLKNLMGKEVSDEKLKEILPLNKLEIEEWGPEIKIETNPDRPDLFSAEGIARQLKGFLGFSKGLPKYENLKQKIKVNAENVKVRPYIVCGIVRGLKLTDDLIKSLMQLQDLLDLTIGRGRKKTSTGIHDLSKVKPPFTYKEIEPEKIKFVPLEMNKELNLKEILEKHPKGREYGHIVSSGKKWPILVDSENNVLSFPPIINGELTRVTEKTKDLFIDVTGLDKNAINQVLNIIVTSLAERGGKIELVKVNNELKPDLKPKEIEVELKEANDLLGLNLNENEAKQLLERANYGVSQIKNGKIKVLIPAYRADILHPVDIIEDIAISYGLNNFKPEMPKLPFLGSSNYLEDFCETMRNLMIGLGFQEVLNFILTSKESQFKLMEVEEEEVVELMKPVSLNYSMCRKWILPELLENLSENKHHAFPQKMFEIGNCVEVDLNEETKTRDIKKLSAVISHSKANFSEITSIINSIADNLNLKFKLENHNHPSFIKGRCGKILLNSKEIGIFGEIHPQVLNNFKIEKPVVGFELNINILASQKV